MTFALAERSLACLYLRCWPVTGTGAGRGAQKYAPEAYKGIPFQRDTYQDNGYADDAMLLTQELYDALLKEYEGKEESEYHADLDWIPVTPAMIGNTWLVVVDYHSRGTAEGALLPFRLLLCFGCRGRRQEGGASPGAGTRQHGFRGGAIRLLVPLANTLLNV